MNGAFYTQVDKVVEIPGADKIQIAFVKGEQCIVSKDIKVGDKGIFFPAGLKLSEDFAHYNNLYRDSEKNKDTSKKGFFENSLRVRTQPFLGVKSEGLFVGAESLGYIPNSGKALEALYNGGAFQELTKVKVCEKYYSPATLNAMSKAKAQKGSTKPQTPYFKEHVDTKHFRHYVNSIPEGAFVYIQNKRHGTSFRVSHTLVKESGKSGWWSKILGWVGVDTSREEWKVVSGTRRVVLHNNPHKEGFHGSEQFRYDVMEQLKPFMPKGMTIYGEIVGYANGKPIMSPHNSKSLKDKEFLKEFGENIVYHYGCEEGGNKFHIYRITQLGVDGSEWDFSQEQIDVWCAEKGFESTTTFEKLVYDGNAELLVEKVGKWQEANKADCDANYLHPSEGLILRVDCGFAQPVFYKEKAFWFRVMEGHCEAEDTEDAS